MSNIKVEFLPSNCISILKPVDQGIIKNVEAKFSALISRKNSYIFTNEVSGSAMINARKIIDMI